MTTPRQSLERRIIDQGSSAIAYLSALEGGSLAEIERTKQRCRNPAYVRELLSAHRDLEAKP